MKFEHQGRRYELLFGGDVQNDRIYLEMNDVSGRKPVSVLYGERDDRGGEIRFMAVDGWPWRRPTMVPLSLVERFIADLKQALGGSGPGEDGGPPTLWRIAPRTLGVRTESVTMLAVSRIGRWAVDRPSFRADP